MERSVPILKLVCTKPRCVKSERPPMDEKTVGTAIYLVGHGSKTKPRLIELQHQRILRYRRALFRRYDIGRSTPTAFIDLHLPSFGMGKVDLMDVPQYTKLLQQVDEGRFGLVFIDVDENPGLTPDYESVFVRSMLVAAGAKVLNAFTDDEGVFARELKERCGPNAKAYEVTDSSDIVCFFPSLVSGIVATALRRELRYPIEGPTEPQQRMYDRIDFLRRLRPYSGGGIPFIEDQLSSDWNKAK